MSKPFYTMWLLISYGKKRTFYEKAATGTSCCYELMKFLLLIKSGRISSSTKTTEIQSHAVVSFFCLSLSGNFALAIGKFICSFGRHQHIYYVFMGA